MQIPDQFKPYDVVPGRQSEYIIHSLTWSLAMVAMKAVSVGVDIL